MVTTPTPSSKKTPYWAGSRQKVQTLSLNFTERTTITSLSSQSRKGLDSSLPPLNLTLYIFRRIGIAIGLRTWFGTGFQVNDNYSGTVSKNRLSGAFGFGIAITTARNFTVEDNFLFGNTNFIGSPGPCKYPVATTMPNARPFVVDKSDTEGTTLQTSFVDVPDGNSLACISPPNGGDNWPFHDIVDTGGLSRVGKIGVALGAFFAMCIIAVVSYGIRRANLKRRQRGKGVVIKLIQNP